jgi:thiol-disulfide isomerase/thioredoxin
MKPFKRQTFLPYILSLLLVIFMTIVSFTASAAENADYARFEKVFNSLEMETIEHTKIKLKDLPSQIVIVNFWASWCIPCLHEMPSLITVSNKFSKKELAVVAINTDEEDQLKNIAKIKKKLDFPDAFIIVPDTKFRIADEFKFSAIPVTVIFKKGKVIYFNNGPVDFLKVPL